MSASVTVQDQRMNLILGNKCIGHIQRCVSRYRFYELAIRVRILYAHDNVLEFWRFFFPLRVWLGDYFTHSATLGCNAATVKCGILGFSSYNVGLFTARPVACLTLYNSQ